MREAVTHPHCDDDVIHTHVVSARLLLSVFATLVGLTAVTVGLAQLSLGAMEIWVSLVIASIKASLVAAYFMHLRYDRGFHTLLLLGSLVFVGLFLALTLMDSQGYVPIETG